MSYAVRVSRAYDDVFDWVDALQAATVVVYEHEADDEVKRTHIHMLLLDSKLKPDAMKTRFRKLYGDIDKFDWSFKSAQQEYEPFITYMSKGKLAPKLAKGIAAEKVADLTAAWVEPEQKTSVTLENGKFVRSVSDVPKKTKSEMLEQMRSRLSDTSSPRERLSAIRKVLIANNQVIGKFKQMEYYDALMMKYYKEDWMNAMEAKINSFYGI